MADHRDFISIMDAVEALISAGHVEHQDEICTLSKDLTKGDIGLRYFLGKSLQDETRRTLSGAQSFFIYSCAAFTARLNLWFPKDARISADHEDAVRQHFSYENCHNHNFDFFTVGLLGPGYRTEFFSTSQDLKDLREGDRIEAEKRWGLTLAKSDALFVPKDSHFHTQYEPESFSMTLNLMPNQKLTSNQYVLQADRSRIQRVIRPYS